MVIVDQGKKAKKYRTAVVKSGLDGWFYGKQMKVAIVGLSDERGMLLALAPQWDLDNDIGIRLDEYFSFGMGHTDHLLCENLLTDAVDEFAIYPMMGGKWKADWLIEQGLASDTGKALEDGWTWPIVKLMPEFFSECVNALGLGAAKTPVVEMDVDLLFDGLLTIARDRRFDGVVDLPGAGQHRAVLRIADVHLSALIDFVEQVPKQVRADFVKAVAAYENTVGGLGSVTTLKRLLPLLGDSELEALDWILGNTNSYWWYGHGASSVAELAEWNRLNNERRELALAKEVERECFARLRKADKATVSLPNAVRRGDINAVRALIARGADSRAASMDGMPLLQYAKVRGLNEIAEVLEAPCERDAE